MNTDFEKPYTIENKIIIFERSTKGWQLEIADVIINGGKDFEGNHVKEIKGSGFAVRHILLNYFEMIAKYIDGYIGEGKSKYYFSEGVKSVFPELIEIDQGLKKNLLKILYEDGRCGLYHGGMTESQIALSAEFPPLGIDSKMNVLLINPHKLSQELLIHFNEYINKLKNPNNNDIRENFEKRFDWHRRIKIRT